MTNSLSQYRMKMIFSLMNHLPLWNPRVCPSVKHQQTFYTMVFLQASSMSKTSLERFTIWTLVPLCAMLCVIERHRFNNFLVSELLFVESAGFKCYCV